MKVPFRRRKVRVVGWCFRTQRGAPAQPIPVKIVLEKAGFERAAVYDFCPSSWLAGSIIQLAKKPGWGDQRLPRWLIRACYPVGWLASWVRMGEELVAVAEKERV